MRIAILGAGPVGLEAALYARTLGLSVRVYERGRVGEHLLRWGHVRLFTPFGMNSTPLGKAAILKENSQHDFPADADCITGREHVHAYLMSLARLSLLRDVIHTGTQVLSISRRSMLKDEQTEEASRARQPFRLLLRSTPTQQQTTPAPAHLQGEKHKQDATRSQAEPVASKIQERVEEADVVLDCTGTYGQHRWMGDGGMPAIGELTAESYISYWLDDVLGERKPHYAGKTIFVYGSGYSAATTVCNLATLAESQLETWVIWLARSTGSQPIKRITNDPLRERDRLAARANTLATRHDGNVEFHNHAIIEAIESAGADRGFKITARCAGKMRTWDADRVIANLGYSPDTNLYRELQMHECPTTLAPLNLANALRKHVGTDFLRLPPLGAVALRNPEPNFYVLGAKSFGRNANFILRTGFEQVREVFTLITGKNDLDLYKK